jgi:hypothetical protein
MASSVPGLTSEQIVAPSISSAARDRGSASVRTSRACRVPTHWNMHTLSPIGRTSIETSGSCSTTSLLSSTPERAFCRSPTVAVEGHPERLCDLEPGDLAGGFCVNHPALGYCGAFIASAARPSRS